MDSYIVFHEILPVVLMTLRAMVSLDNFQELGCNWNWDGETLTKANRFLFQLQSPLFLLSLKILLEVLTSLRGLTLKLQMEAIDVLYAYRKVRTIVTTLRDMRSKSEKGFSKLFAETTSLGKALHGDDFVLSKPRTNARQTQRSDVQASTAKQYFHITLYNEFLSHVVAEFDDRFIDTPLECVGLLHLLSRECYSSELEDMPDDLVKAAEFYEQDVPHSVMLPTEYRMWVSKWQQHTTREEVPKKLVDAFFACDRFTFPNIHVLLHLALAMPITSCESERSFSQLKLLKTPLLYNFCCSSWLTSIDENQQRRVQQISRTFRNGETSAIFLSNAPKAYAVAMFFV